MLRIAINAQLAPAASGGISSFLGALISALGALEDGDEEYVLIGNDDSAEWLHALKGDNQTVHLVDAQRASSRLARAIRRRLAPLYRPIRKALQRAILPGRDGFPVVVPISKKFWKSLDCAVVHFPFQHYEITGLPTVYNPHDLQHLHYPEYFAADTYAWRESFYPAGCRFSRKIVVASQWVKEDIVLQYGVDPAKIQVIPWAPPTQHYTEMRSDERSELASRLNLPERYLFYPAATWPHKNHAQLFRALARVRDRHALQIPLVCTGSTGGKDSRVAQKQGLESLIEKLGLKGQVKFLGYLENAHLRAVYQMCSAVVMPTLFEAAAGPIFEAWQEGKPVACSTVTSLPEQVGDAALLFDPNSELDIANALHAIWTDDALARTLAQKGQQRLKDFTWDRTARAYRAVYRAAARLNLTEADQRLLAWDWMRFPKEKGE